MPWWPRPDLRSTHEPAVRLRPCGQLAAEQGHPLAHAGQAVPAGRPGCLRPGPVVGDLDQHLVSAAVIVRSSSAWPQSGAPVTTGPAPTALPARS